MTVTVNNFIEQSVIGVSSKGTYGWRVTGRPEALLDTATQERVKAIAIGCSTTAEPCRQAVKLSSRAVWPGTHPSRSTQA